MGVEGLNHSGSPPDSRSSEPRWPGPRQESEEETAGARAWVVTTRFSHWRHEIGPRVETDACRSAPVAPKADLTSRPEVLRHCRAAALRRRIPRRAARTLRASTVPLSRHPSRGAMLSQSQPVGSGLRPVRWFGRARFAGAGSFKQKSTPLPADGANRQRRLQVDGVRHRAEHDRRNAADGHREADREAGGHAHVAWQVEWLRTIVTPKVPTTQTPTSIRGRSRLPTPPTYETMINCAIRAWVTTRVVRRPIRPRPLRGSTSPRRPPATSGRAACSRPPSMSERDDPERHEREQREPGDAAQRDHDSEQRHRAPLVVAAHQPAPCRTAG